MVASARGRAQRELKLLSRNDIEAQIAEGRHIFILNGDVIKADAWLPYHPGGPKAIEHMVGRDATDEVQAYVSPTTLQIVELNSFKAFIPRKPSSACVLIESVAYKLDGRTLCRQFKEASSGVGSNSNVA